MNKTELFRSLENQFIYELQNIPIYGGSRYPATAKYFSDQALETLTNEALSQLANDIEPNSILTLEHLPTSMEEPLLLKITILAIQSMTNDIKNKIPKVKMLISTSRKETETIRIASENLADNYQILYNEIIQPLKNTAKKDTYIVHKPIVKKDEVLIVKVGNEDRPASQQDIADVQTALSQISIDNQMAFITHHLINFTVIKSKDLPKLKEDIKEEIKEISAPINPITSLDLKNE